MRPLKTMPQKQKPYPYKTRQQKTSICHKWIPSH